MGIQAATTGQLEYAQNLIIAQWKFTAEHNAPCLNLIDRFTLPKGNKTYRFPKVGQATFLGLVDGVDMVDSQDINLSYVDTSPSEVGAKFILTDKMVRQSSDDAFLVIGRQLGDGMARKRDTDIITLFASLDNAWGADGAILGLTQATGLVTLATTYKFISPVSCVHHPNALGQLSKGYMIGTTAGWAPAVGVINGEAARRLANWFTIAINGVNFYHDGNIAKIAAVDSGYGAIFSKGAMACVESQAPTTARERDESLRGTEVIMVADYIMVEVDGGQGASARYEIGNSRTT